jgi:hypothetical protein
MGAAIEQGFAGSDERMDVAGDLHPLVGRGYNRLRLNRPPDGRLH